MQTDFATLRQYFEASLLQVRGDDATSRKVREALDLLIQVVTIAEQSRKEGAHILQFPKGVRAP